MRCPKCNEPLDEETVFCGNCGTQIAPVFAQGATVSEAETAQIRPRDGQGPIVSRYGPVGQSFQAPQPPSQYVPNPTQQAAPSAPPFAPIPPTLTPPPGGRGNRRLIFLVFIVALLLISVAAGAFVFLTRNSTNTGLSGSVSFSDSQIGHTNAVKIIINGLKAPPTGSQYHAWLQNTQTES